MSTMDALRCLGVIDVLAEEMRAAQKRRADGSRGPGRPMRRFLERLLTKIGHEDEELGVARYQELQDLMQGIYGPGLLLDAILELEADLLGPKSLPDQQMVVASLMTGRKAMPEMQLCRGMATAYLDMPGLLSTLVWLRRDWADATVVDLVSGGYGPVLQKSAIYGLANGLGDEDSGRSSLVYECYAAGRANVVRAVADLGLPDFMAEAAAERHPRATTSTGRWLDILSNTRFGEWFEGAGAEPTTLAHLIGTFNKPDVSLVLAEVLAKHDPEHRAISDRYGSPGYAHIMEAVMNRRIETSGTPATPAGNPKPIHRNRAL